MYNKIINMIKMKRVKVITMAEKGNIYFFLSGRLRSTLITFRQPKAKLLNVTKILSSLNQKDACMHRAYTLVYESENLIIFII